MIMKKLVLFVTIIFTSSIYVEGQTIAELESRWTPRPIEPPKNCKEKFENFWWDFIDFFTPGEDLSGVTYKYNDVFPVGLTVDRSWYLFKLGLDFGFSFDNKKYNDKFNPFAYVGVSPGLYMRFISIDLGLGALYSDAIEIKQWSDTSTDDFGFTSDDGSTSVSGSITTSTSGSATSIYPKFNFLLKPSATIYIPLNSWEEYFITLSAGYNYFYKFEQLNGWSFGIGFHWAI